MTEAPEQEATQESLLAAAAEFDKTNGDAPEGNTAALITKNKEPEAPAESKSAEDKPKVNPVAATDTPAKQPTDDAGKWAKNDERKAKTWQDINAEKESIRREREEITKARAEVDQARRSVQATEPVRDEHGATVKDYQEAAKAYRAKGDSAMADAADKLAEGLSREEQQVNAQRGHEQNARKWQEHYAKLSDEKPDLQNPESALYKEAMRALEGFPMLKSLPDGIVYAVRAAELNLKAAQFDGTKAELDELRKEKTKLQKKLSIGSGTPTEPLDEDKPFEKMSLKEQKAALEQTVRAYDRDAGFD